MFFIIRVMDGTYHYNSQMPLKMDTGLLKVIEEV